MDIHYIKCSIYVETPVDLEYFRLSFLFQCDIKGMITGMKLLI